MRQWAALSHTLARQWNTHLLENGPPGPVRMPVPASGMPHTRVARLPRFAEPQSRNMMISLRGESRLPAERSFPRCHLNSKAIHKMLPALPKNQRWHYTHSTSSRSSHWQASQLWGTSCPDTHALAQTSTLRYTITNVVRDSSLFRSNYRHSDGCGISINKKAGPGPQGPTRLGLLSLRTT